MSQDLGVLLVEDDEVDAEVVRRHFARLEIPHLLHIARNGETALELLEGSQRTEAIPMPLLVILDLKLPRVSGVEFLRRLRDSSDPDLRGLPVIVLTSSGLPRDREDTATLGVSDYFEKGREYDDFTRSLARMLA